ncbi:hypothetical protein MELE44368_15800 [Mycolicibacterium elephantis DSM 44368]|uniref:Solute-binding protein family 3/N-terminal domain-containing protein n=1 Tax=Mycolicibacterium elephantis DSM 44368 TaxID=1335622 RepID=A0A439DWE2_9MYCO|nr:hypothetical protein MELE44368_15800 [Mycolicibacterium elephantis DSM 44368]
MVVVLSVLVLAGCGATSSVENPRLSLGVVVDPAWAQVPVAEAFDLFQRAGVQVDVVNFASGAAAMESLAGGAVDVVTAADAPTSAGIIASDDVRVLAQSAYHNNMRIIADGRRGITSLSDLNGRRVGTTFGTSAHYMAATTLAEHGVSAELVQVAPPELRTALTRGDIDAAAIFEPYATQISEAWADDAVVFRSDPPYTSRVYINTRTDVLDSRRDQITRLLAALQCASTLLEESNPRAVNAVGEATGLQGSTLGDVVSGYHYELVLDQPAADGLHTLATWAVAEGNIPEGDGVPDFAAAFDEQALAESSSVGPACDHSTE